MTADADTSWGAMFSNGRALAAITLAAGVGLNRELSREPDAETATTQLDLLAQIYGHVDRRASNLTRLLTRCGLRCGQRATRPPDHHDVVAQRRQLRGRDFEQPLVCTQCACEGELAAA